MDTWSVAIPAALLDELIQYAGRATESEDHPDSIFRRMVVRAASKMLCASVARMRMEMNRRIRVSARQRRKLMFYVWRNTSEQMRETAMREWFPEYTMDRIRFEVELYLRTRGQVNVGPLD